MRFVILQADGKNFADYDQINKEFCKFIGEEVKEDVFACWYNYIKMACTTKMAHLYEIYGRRISWVEEKYFGNKEFSLTGEQLARLLLIDACATANTSNDFVYLSKIFDFWTAKEHRNLIIKFGF